MSERTVKMMDAVIDLGKKLLFLVVFVVIVVFLLRSSFHTLTKQLIEYKNFAHKFHPDAKKIPSKIS